MGTCSDCVFWNHETWIMNKYGEGTGICSHDGQVRFCSHPCAFCEPDEEAEAKLNEEVK